MKASAKNYKSELLSTHEDISDHHEVSKNSRRGVNLLAFPNIYKEPNPGQNPLKPNAEFTDAELFSRYGTFNIRVYKDSSYRETVVLWSHDVPLKEPVLTRVHSECLTGDVFGSQHCDCGQQLIKSLRLINKQGGVLIYLRQEGRGIGLFEKIKSYKLQAEGYDTFEANLKLGHNPDSRSYEMVKVALKDLGIEKIRLLTNNPSKVSDIASLGISVVDIANLIVKPCKHNRKYLNTKRQKFSHFSLKKHEGYQYQFYASNPECIHEVGLFLKEKNLDPLLMVCAAISLDHIGLKDSEKLLTVTNIIEACKNYSRIRPVLHFSCLKSKDWNLDLKEVIAKLDRVDKIQINDFDLNQLPSLEWLLQTKKVDIPVPSEYFELIHKRTIRNLLKKYNSLVILDDSKGTGKSQNLNVVKSQIDELLKYGINHIGLAGGFGPNALETYFHLKRFYRVNFSIDSETGVKTNGDTDTSKVRLYLTQLFRNDNPKQNEIQQTRDFLFKHRRSDWETVKINEKSFRIHPNVFHAGKFPSSIWFANEIAAHLKKCASFCEIGCGAGVISCLSALTNPLLKVVATDLNADASENTRVNAKLLGLSKRISVRQGDVLDGIAQDERFDLIFWALPFGFLDPGVSISLEEAQVFDPGYRAIRKLLQTAKQHLTPKGKLLLGFSSDLGHFDLLQTIAEELKATIKIISQTTIQEGLKLQFEILELSYEDK